MSGPRILLAKPGLDGHDRGLKVIAFALHEASAEVIYLGLRQSPAAIVAAAAAEDTDLIGISVLGRYYRTALVGLLRRINSCLMRPRDRAAVAAVIDVVT